MVFYSEVVKPELEQTRIAQQQQEAQIARQQQRSLDSSTATTI